MDYNGPQSTIRFTRYLRHPPLQRRKWTLKLDEIAKRACAEDGWLVVQGMEVLDKRLVVDIVHLM